MLSSNNDVKNKEGRTMLDDLASGFLYFSFAFFIAVLTSYMILSSTQGPYIGYRVPHYLIVFVLTAFLTTLVFVVASVIKYARKIIYALICSLISVTVSFYLYEHYIIISRHLSALPLPLIIILSNGSHSTYVIDIGQLSLIIAVILLYVTRNPDKNASPKNISK